MSNISQELYGARAAREADRDTPRSPKNLRVELYPYPHLRDDEGCILANDYIDDAKMRFILDAVASAARQRKRRPDDL